MRIILTFPLTGVTTLSKKSKYKILDYNNPSVNGWRDFHDQVKNGKWDFIIMPYNQTNVKQLSSKGYDFITVYPSRNVLGEWQDRCDEAGKEEDYVSTLSRNWKEWHDLIQTYKYGKIFHQLNIGEYITDEMLSFFKEEK